jgi:hypothetical protein
LRHLHSLHTMPFTPFHLGPGAAFKAIGGRHFSFMVFGGTQVLMDIEPLVGLIRGSEVLHGYSHTLPGAALIGLVAGLIGRPISAFSLRLLRIRHAPFTWTAAFAGAWLGSFSHILLDGLMHGDMLPFWPLAHRNLLLDRFSYEAIHLLCLALGVLGALALAWRDLRSDNGS